MVVEDIEKIKQEYTDKYVVVDADRPELARFRDYTGVVKTVNMSGRALVEFIDFNLNIGWHDIDVDYLKIVDKPLPKPEKPVRKPEAAAPASKKPATDKPKPARPASGRPSVAEMMAAARGDKAGGGAAAAEPLKPAAKPAAPAAAGKPAKVERGKMSVAEMLAAARGEKAGGAAASAEAPPAAEEPAAETAAVPKAPAEKPAAGGIVKVDRTKLSVAEMIAYCREKDAK